MGAQPKKSFFIDPAQSLISSVVGEKTAKWLNPLDPLTRTLQKKAGEKLDAPEEARQKEIAKQDELLKRLALGDNPYLGEDEKLS